VHFYTDASIPESIPYFPRKIRDLRINPNKRFGFLKSYSFSVSKVYLKNKSRIKALAMIMVLYLMISLIAEWNLRPKLEDENEMVPDQKGKSTKRTTMRWMFFKFQGITELITPKKGKVKSKILNMEEIHWKILSLMERNLKISIYNYVYLIITFTL